MEMNTGIQVSIGYWNVTGMELIKDILLLQKKLSFSKNEVQFNVGNWIELMRKTCQKIMTSQVK